MRRFLQTYSFLLTGRWIGWFALCCVGALLCLYLGNWQFGRAEQIEHGNQLIVENHDADPYTGQEAVQAFTDFDGSQQWHPAELTGEYVEDGTVLARNRTSSGQIGYEVLVPLRTDQGPTILISRGWIPTSDAGDGSASEVPAPPAGDVTVTARVQPGEGTADRSAPEGQVASIHLPDVEEASGQDLVDGAYGQMHAEQPPAQDAPAPFMQPDLDHGPQLSYSMQWTAFAVLVFVAYAYSARQKVRNDAWDREYAARIEAELAQYYDADGTFVGVGDGRTEEDLIRQLEMVDDMPAHLRDLTRPKRRGRRFGSQDAAEEDAALEAPRR
ncbi:SURF1 family protein [Kocuria palustris]|uniref:SURF1 family cytochrome oxidase biogenesis protein n=1 Tax=Kocuria palustris TaxID=71999 RepID=UPI0011A54A45|nr:SURF1 family protein [Kocuria palustris]